MVKWHYSTYKSMKVRNIKDDSLVDPYIQELQMNLEQIKGFDHLC
jgi:glucosamine--fructose-6-phosphate aminotransferase (isomerizing)